MELLQWSAPAVVPAGGFAEIISTEYIDLLALAVGDLLSVEPALLEITQIGKDGHSRCAMYEQQGDSLMPREGISARMNEGGDVAVGDAIIVVRDLPPK